MSSGDLVEGSGDSTIARCRYLCEGPLMMDDWKSLLECLSRMYVYSCECGSATDWGRKEERVKYM